MKELKKKLVRKQVISLLLIAVVIAVSAITIVFSNNRQTIFSRAAFDGIGGACPDGCDGPDGCDAWERCDNGVCIDTTNGNTKPPDQDSCGGGQSDPSAPVSGEITHNPVGDCIWTCGGYGCAKQSDVDHFNNVFGSANGLRKWLEEACGTVAQPTVVPATRPPTVVPPTITQVPTPLAPNAAVAPPTLTPVARNIGYGPTLTPTPYTVSGEKPDGGRIPTPTPILHSLYSQIIGSPTLTPTPYTVSGEKPDEGKIPYNYALPTNIPTPTSESKCIMNEFECSTIQDTCCSTNYRCRRIGASIRCLATSVSVTPRATIVPSPTSKFTTTRVYRSKTTIPLTPLTFQCMKCDEIKRVYGTDRKVFTDWCYFPLYLLNKCIPFIDNTNK